MNKQYSEGVISQSSKWKIIKCRRRGFNRYFELYESKNFLFFKYWSLRSWSMEISSLNELIKNWEGHNI